MAPFAIFLSFWGCDVEANEREEDSNIYVGH